MPEITDEKLLPEWMLATLQKERELLVEMFLGETTVEVPDSRSSQRLGAPGYRVYDLDDGWWAWDNGAGGVLISDGTLLPPGSHPYPWMVRWINYVDVLAGHPRWTAAERVEAGRRADAGFRPAVKPVTDDTTLPIEWDAYNYLCFSVVAPEGDEEANAALLALEMVEQEQWGKATTDLERSQAEDAFTTSFTLDWGGTAAEMAANCRRAVEWLEAVSARFPGHAIETTID